MTVRPSDNSLPRYQSIVLWVRFSGFLARTPLALTVLSDLVQEVLHTLDLGGIILDDGPEVVLALEGGEGDIEQALVTLQASRYVDIVVACRGSIPATRYLRAVLARPVLTASERVWLRMEIDAGFSNLDTLPTLLEWLAIRQVEPQPSLQARGCTSRAAALGDGDTTNILQFRQR